MSNPGPPLTPVSNSPLQKFHWAPPTPCKEADMTYFIRRKGGAGAEACVPQRRPIRARTGGVCCLRTSLDKGIRVAPSGSEAPLVWRDLT